MTLQSGAWHNHHVPVATHVQKRGVAIATALILLCVGLLARHHEAEAAHVRERSGRVVHAQELAGHHEASGWSGRTAHLHGREVHRHAGECTLVAIAHVPAVASVAPSLLAAPAGSAAAPLPARAATAARSIATYRIAPKTSPPAS